MLHGFHQNTQIPKNQSYFVGVPKIKNASSHTSLNGPLILTINIMFHLSVDVLLLAIAVQSKEEKHFVHSCYKKQFYNLLSCYEHCPHQHHIP